MIHNKLSFGDRLPHGPYKGLTVREVLEIDPEELTAYTEDRLLPKYDITPEVLRQSYAKAQDRLQWDDFINLWRQA